MQRRTDRDLSLGVVPAQLVDLLVEPLLEVSHQSGATRQDNVIVEVDLQVGVHLLDRLVGQPGDPTLALFELGVRHLDNRRVEHALGGRDSLAMRHLDDLLVWQLVGSLLLGQVIVTVVHLSVVVHGYVAHFLLHLTNVMVVVVSDGHLGLLQLLDQPFSDVLAGHIDRLHGVRQCVPLKDWHRVGHSFTAFSDETGGSAGRKQG